MNKIRTLLALTAFLSAGVVAAAGPVSDKGDMTVFKEKYEVAPLNIVRPTVVEVVLDAPTNYGIGIFENETGDFQPYEQLGLLDGFSLSVDSSSPMIGDPKALFDADYRTAAEFDLDQDGGHATLEFSANMMAEVVGLSLALDNHVAFPHEIAVSAWVGGAWKTVVARKKTNDSWNPSKFIFPNTTAQKWRVEFWHAQPLKLKEIGLVLREENFKNGPRFKWLARPEMSYTIFANAQADPKIQTTEAGILGDPELIVGNEAPLEPNPVFLEPDTDEDQVPDYLDNCVLVTNADQKDIDGNGAGDACEDFDADGIKNAKDNCSDRPNAQQSDEDGDGIGDACDTEESRLTEKNKWLPWAVMGITALILVAVMGRTVKKR